MGSFVLDDVQQDLVIQETKKYIALASQLYQQEFAYVPVKFDLTGRTIGMYKHIKKGRVIRYNSHVFAKYFEENIRDTVPHEVAHYIVDMQFVRKDTRPHGAEWKSVMADFGADNNRTASFDLSDIPQRQYSTIPYGCGCQQHQLGVRRHNKVIKRKARYFCRECGDVLKAI
jgi:SprT protein